MASKRTAPVACRLTMVDFKETERVFTEAMQRPPSEREAFLGERCGADLELLREVQELIALSDAEFLSSSALQDVAGRLASEMPSLRPGDCVGPRRVLAGVGSGGMGRVYKTWNEAEKRDEALKVMLPDFGNDDSRLRRFRREARAVSRLRHPGIARVYEVGETKGLHFIAMEWVDGETLATRLGSSGPMSADEIIRITRQIAQALSAAHRGGLIHRDIKPANLMLTPEGRVKLLDFGLVKPLRENLSDLSTDSLTMDELIVGTMDYMSPEQILGKEVDVRTDLFSLGVVIYQMATGQLPHQGNNPADIMQKILAGKPWPIARFNPAASVGLEKIVRKCLAKDPAERFQSLGELLAALSGEPVKRSLLRRLMDWWPA